MSERQNNDLVIISPDERGFWHADLYLDSADVDLEQTGCSPDGWMTRPTFGSVKDDAAAAWPEAEVVIVDEIEDGDEG